MIMVEQNDRELAKRIVATVEERINAELDVVPWEETLKSEAKTIQRVIERAKRSGKRATILEKWPTQQHSEVKTEGLQPNEWHLYNMGIAPGAKHVTFYEYDNVRSLMTALNQLQQEGEIEGFDVGTPLSLPEHVPGGSEPQKKTNVVAVFVTSPYSKRVEINSRISDLSKQIREPRSL